MANLALTPASIIPATTTFARGTAGATIAQGDLVYKDVNKLLQLSDANGAAATQAVDGMAMNGGSAGQPINYITDDTDLLLGAGVSGDEYCLSATPGKMCPRADLATPSKVIFVGVMKAGFVMNFRPVAGGAIPA